MTNINKKHNSAPRLPKKVEYWTNKGKDGKKTMIYFHDDLDGIYSAIAMKNHIEKNGFEVVGYGIVNYQEGWSNIELNNKYINIALDYAENVDGIDIYIDHHGEFKEDGDKMSSAIKTQTSSAYEGIMIQLGLPNDSLVLEVIDMIDAAKYDDYNIDIKNILKFDIKLFKNKLEFAAAFNQLLKRSDYKTFIEVVANCKDVSPNIYNIYTLFKILYPANNLNTFKLNKLAKEMGYVMDNGYPDVVSLIIYLKKIDPEYLKDFEKSFLDDAFWRLEQMTLKTRALTSSNKSKVYIDSQNKFKQLFQKRTFKGNTKIDMPGYQIIGNMCFVPSGTWANALRARSILETDLLNDERIPTIEYNISNDSLLYNNLKLKHGQTLELVGDISEDENITLFNVKLDVTDNKDIEGIKGTLSIINDNVIFRAKRPIYWILLQYGNTLQVASLHNFDLYVKEYLPKFKDGTTITDLGEYCNNLLDNMSRVFGYDVLSVSDASTKSGGHKGIGSISNIFGHVKYDENIVSVPNPKNTNDKILLDDISKKYMKHYDNIRFLDLIKNKMIDDLSGIEFKDLKMQWGDLDEKKPTKNKVVVKKIMMTSDIRNAEKIKNI